MKKHGWKTMKTYEKHTCWCSIFSIFELGAIPFGVCEAVDTDSNNALFLYEVPWLARRTRVGSLHGIDKLYKHDATDPVSCITWKYFIHLNPNAEADPIFQIVENVPGVSGHGVDALAVWRCFFLVFPIPNNGNCLRFCTYFFLATWPLGCGDVNSF